MFKVNRSITVLDPKQKPLHALYSSINQPNIPLGGSVAEPTFAFVCSLRSPAGACEVFIMLYQPATATSVFYESDRGAVSETNHPKLEKEALQFVEKMGFMLDNQNFEKLSATEKTAIIENLPPFKNNVFVEVEGEAEVIMEEADPSVEGSLPEAELDLLAADAIAELSDAQPIESVESEVLESDDLLVLDPIPDANTGEVSEISPTEATVFGESGDWLGEDPQAAAPPVMLEAEPAIVATSSLDLDSPAPARETTLVLDKRQALAKLLASF